MGGGAAALGHCLLPSKHRTRGPCPRADGARREVRGSPGGRAGRGTRALLVTTGRGLSILSRRVAEVKSFLQHLQHLPNTYCVPAPGAFSQGRTPRPLQNVQRGISSSGMNAHSHLRDMYEHLLHTGPVPSVLPAGQPMGWRDITSQIGKPGPRGAAACRGHLAESGGPRTWAGASFALWSWPLPGFLLSLASPLPAGPAR